MREPKPYEERHQIHVPLSNNLDYLGPQLLNDWTEQQSTNVRIDLNTGREKIRIHRKGMIEVTAFDQIKQNDDFGPGTDAVYHSECRRQ
jgi:hypothetical protein